MKSRKFALNLCALAVVFGVLVALPAQANITITPTMVLIEGRDRYADVNIANTTSQRQTYELEWKFLKMDEGTGHYQGVEKSLTDFDLTQNLVFTPRRVTLAPKGVQKVRLGLRLKGEVPPPGDYRAHLQFISYAPEPETPAGQPSGRESQIRVGLNVGFSIPVVYRVGDGSGDATIGTVTTEINPKTNKIEAVIPVTRNDGPYGTMGIITVDYSGKRIGQLRNANIFSEIKNRTFRIPLDVKSLSGGALDITYVGSNSDQDIVYDNKRVNIGQ